MPDPSRAMNRVTFTSLKKIKADGEKIACLTAYDASFARVLDEAGVEVALVGDSLGIVVQGGETTVPVGVSDMVYHCRCVARAARRALVLCDMPFMSYYTVGEALANATRLMKEGGAHGVKLEAGERQLEVVRALADCGIPCCAHIGLRPQWVHKLGGYKVQASDAAAENQLHNDARALADAGADLVVIECVPSQVGASVAAAVEIPVIGIGAGADCDGQVLVLHDVLGMTDPMPRFAENFLRGRDSIQAAVAAYVAAVKTGKFPPGGHFRAGGAE